ncbi:hypothetical protein VB715_20385 [Crocosphaera sp. UHCC 0190]|uniref:hypothetical protein n=1 Tax=Crocosphaera sp. UHCC 0190 TaxID=3110246 RepID=UPI002B2165D5|nr:hypothetical protein [Crocosphaera sp. UHCC 0190]MEA5512136.1 hypothetical protein [Crocosphaera sp. UHCC 0190]
MPTVNETPNLFNYNSFDSPFPNHSGESGFLLTSQNPTEQSSSLGTNLETQLSEVSQTLQTFSSENTLETTTNQESSTSPLSQTDDLIQALDSSTEPITGVQNTVTPLVFSDQEMGSLDSNDNTYQTRYQDEYILTGFGKNQAVTLNLDSLGFGASLQLVNRQNQEVIANYSSNSLTGISNAQLTFTAQDTIQYLVRVTSNGTSTTGSYELGTTLGELTLGLNDKTITSSLTTTDKLNNLRSGRYADDYHLTDLSPFQTVNIRLASSQFNTYLQVLDAKTGKQIAYNDNNSKDAESTTNSLVSFKTAIGVDYIVRVTSNKSGETGDYSLSVDSNATLSGGWDKTDDSNHPVIQTQLMDNYLLSDVNSGQDIHLTLDSGSSSGLVQLLNRNTGEILLSSNNQILDFTAVEGINYGVRVIGSDGVNYSLTTNTGFLFDSTDISANQTIDTKLAKTDNVNLMEWQTRSATGYYADGYSLMSQNLVPGQSIELNLMSSKFDAFLYLLNAKTGELIARNDDGGEGSNSRLVFTPEAAMDYLVMAASYNAKTGDYTLSAKTL